MIWAFDVDSPRSDFAVAFFQAMLARGCLVRPIGKTVYFMPPYIIEEAQMLQLQQATLAVLAQLAGHAAAENGPETALP